MRTACSADVEGAEAFGCVAGGVAVGADGVVISVMLTAAGWRCERCLDKGKWFEFDLEMSLSRSKQLVYV